MRTVIALVIGVLLGLWLTGVIPAHSQPDPQLLNTKIERLMKFSAAVSGLEVKGKPIIKYVTQETLDRLYFGDQYDPSMKGWIGAAAKGGVIYLNQNFKLGRDDYILVHELTHFLQFENQKFHDMSGAARTFDEKTCPGLVEPEAYRVQDAFVLATGRGQRGVGLKVYMAYMACSQPY